MNALTLVFLSACAILLLSVCSTDALSCYNCIGCNDPFDADKYSSSQYLQDDCSGSCSKSKLNDIVTRICLPFVKKDDCESSGDAEVCFCTSDKCNGSSGLTVSIVTGFLAAIGSIYSNYM